MKFWFVIGTAAELIKMIPIIDEAESRGIDWYLISTGQSGLNLWAQYQDFGLPEKRIIHLIHSNSDLANSAMALKWLAKAVFRASSQLRSLMTSVAGRGPNTSDYWFVHGDTFSTLIGAIYGRRLKTRVVHVEAGLRSHDIFNPFPEEINRRLVSRLAHYHMAPDQNAADNLRRSGVKRNVTITAGNTVLDSLNVALRRYQAVDLPPGDYAVANIHRYENLSSEIRWQKILDVLIEAAEHIPVYLVTMPNTAAKLQVDENARRRLEAANVKILPRLPFSRFVHLMHKANFMITDGGSNQQECFHFGLPCLILREKTESLEGIGGCCVLSRFDDGLIQDFLKDPQMYRRDPPRNLRRPTDLVYASLMPKAKVVA